MIFRQFLHTDPVAASYLVGCGGRGVCAVVDPVADVGPYEQAASQFGMRIQYVIDTHVHADHISGGRELADRAGAEYVLHASVAAGRTRGVRDAERLALGNVEIEVWHTPGHTPEHICLLVTDHTRGVEPWLLLSGHTLLIGDMGRTELADEAARGAADLYASAVRLRQLPDAMLVWPGAFAGSVCGRHLSGHPASTIGFERRFNRAFAIEDRDTFIAAMLRDIPEPPAHASDVRARNLVAARAA